MTRYSLYISLTIYCSFVIAGCQSLVQDVPDSKIAQEPQKPVIVSFISPQDSLLAVSIKLTQTVLGTQQTNSQVVQNAVVTLAEGNRFIALPFVQGSDGIYAAPARNFPVQAGKTYKLTVLMPSGPTLTSSATVPADVPIQEITLDSLANSLNPNERYYLQIRWQDPLGSNYYRIQGYQSYTTTAPTSATNQAPTITTSSINFPGQRGRYLLTDQNEDGSRFTSARGFYQKTAVRAYINNKPVIGPAGNLFISLLNTDKAYYDYHEALKRYDNSEGNPFAEPVLLPGNIQGGGLGCFAAYNRSSRTIVLK